VAATKVTLLGPRLAAMMRAPRVLQRVLQQSLLGQTRRQRTGRTVLKEERRAGRQRRRRRERRRRRRKRRRA